MQGKMYGSKAVLSAGFESHENGDNGLSQKKYYLHERRQMLTERYVIK